MIRLLLVDDHDIVREGLKQLIAADAGMRVVAEAGSGNQALDRVRETELDVVVLDLSLPDRSGFDVLRQMHAVRPALPVLILSMHSEEEFAVRTFRAGAAGYLTKNSAASQLLNGIRKVAAGGRFVTPELAEHLAFELQRKEGDEPHKLLSEREFQVFLAIA
ncbi:MAG TPA: response regulator transcription factor, partial [Thermoanaerobaculia bacterium]